PECGRERGEADRDRREARLREGAGGEDDPAIAPHRATVPDGGWLGAPVIPIRRLTPAGSGSHACYAPPPGCGADAADVARAGAHLGAPARGRHLPRTLRSYDRANQPTAMGPEPSRPRCG